MDQETRDKVKKLPAWARDLIERLEVASEPAIEEAVRCRREAAKWKEQAVRYRDANAALMEILSCAGRNNIDWAAKTADVLEGYSIFKSGNEDNNYSLKGD